MATAPKNHRVVITLLQQFPAGHRDSGASTDFFYGLLIWILVLVPLVLVILAAAVKKKRTPALPHVTDLTWNDDVSASAVPVVVHAYRTWSIGDRVVENQVVRLAEEARGRFRALWLDLDKNPAARRRFPTLEERSVGLFVRGRLVWQATGVHDHLTILREIDPWLPAVETA